MAFKNKADEKAWFAEYRKTEKARELHKERNRKYRERHKDRLNERACAWLATHHERRKEIRKSSEKRGIDNLSDRYVRRTIAKVYAIKAKEIPEVIVSVHREILKLKRAIKNEKRT